MFQITPPKKLTWSPKIDGLQMFLGECRSKMGRVAKASTQSRDETREIETGSMGHRTAALGKRAGALPHSNRSEQSSVARK